MTRSAKEILNRQATLRLAQLGHSEPMIQEAKRQAWWWLRARGGALRRGRRLLAGQAVIWPAAGRAELAPTEVPLPGRGEVTVAVQASVVSPGTERAQYLMLPNAKVMHPYRPGYSAAGSVVAVGSRVRGLGAGDLVAVRGVPHASVATVPVELVHRVPDGVAAEEAAFVQLGVVCGNGLRHAAIAPGERVCILGAGAIGALTLRLAIARGAGEVTVVARSRAKEPSARVGGAARFLTVDEDADRVAALEAPVVIEATGDPGALACAVAAAAPGGRIVLLGSPRGRTAVPVAALRDKGLRARGAHVATLEHGTTEAAGDPVRAAADEFLDALSGGRLVVADLSGPGVDPRSADAFYRRLATAADVVAAHFDWSLLPERDRLRPARLLRLPDISGRGIELRRRPLPAAGRPRATHSSPRSEPTAVIRIGLLGCGDVAVQNAAAVAAAPNAVLSACYDPVVALAEELARPHGAAVAGSVDALLDRDDVDAVFLAVPHHLHAPLALEAIAAGKHLIVEKPPANALAPAVEIVKAAERAGTVLSFCFPHRYDPRVVAAREAVARGALGELTGALVSFWMDKTPAYWRGGFSARSPSSWRASRSESGGGVLIMNVSHYVDLLRHVTGLEPDAVTAVAGAENDASEVEDAISVGATYPNGAVGTLVACSAQRGNPGGNNEFRLWGREGHVVVEPDARVYTLRPLEGLRTSRWHSLGPFPPTAIRTVFVRRFAAALASGAPPDVSAADGLAVQAFIEAAYRSSRLGARLRPAELLREAGA